MRRSAATGSESWVRCTPSAPAASATSARSLITSRAPWRRVLSLEQPRELQQIADAQVLFPQLNRAEPGAEALVDDLGDGTPRDPPIGDQVEREVEQRPRQLVQSGTPSSGDDAVA